MSLINRILLGIALNSIALYIVTYFMPEITYTGGIKFFVVAGIIIGVLNAFIKPLMKILAFPLLLMTIGLFSIVINVVIFWLAMKLVNAFQISDITVNIKGVFVYFLAAIIFGIINGLLHIIFKKK